MKVKAHSGISGNEFADKAASKTLNSFSHIVTFDFEHNHTTCPGPTWLKVPFDPAPLTSLARYSDWKLAGNLKASLQPNITVRTKYHLKQKTSSRKMQLLINDTTTSSSAPGHIDPYSIVSLLKDPNLSLFFLKR